MSKPEAKSPKAKSPTLAELRKEARRVFGPGADVGVDVYGVCFAGDEYRHVDVHALRDDDARSMLLTMLRALPDWRKM